MSNLLICFSSPSTAVAEQAPDVRADSHKSGLSGRKTRPMGHLERKKALGRNTDSVLRSTRCSFVGIGRPFEVDLDRLGHKVPCPNSVQRDVGPTAGPEEPLDKQDRGHYLGCGQPEPELEPEVKVDFASSKAEAGYYSTVGAGAPGSAKGYAVPDKDRAGAVACPFVQPPEQRPEPKQRQ
ncbi:MAG: hypothetical protein KUG74_04785 [Rhodobacteraceae bacterium]|nr:hypothetical protein [Paracoccaceae bacterium]